MLCGLAERVRNAVRVFRMLMSRLSRDWHADVAPHRLPGRKSGIAKKEPQQQQHIDAEAAARAAVIVAAAVAAALALILRGPAGPSRRTRAKSPTPATAVIIAAAGVAERATREASARSADPLFQKANLPAAPAAPATPAEPAAAAVAAVRSILAAALALMVSRPHSGRLSNQEGELQGSGPRP
jgi:hypothetical protein